MITINDLVRITGSRSTVTFNGDSTPFYIVVAERCDGECLLEAGEPCAGVVTLEPVDEPNRYIHDVHIGANGSFERTVA